MPSILFRANHYPLIGWCSPMSHASVCAAVERNICATNYKPLP